MVKKKKEKKKAAKRNQLEKLYKEFQLRQGMTRRMSDAREWDR